MLGVWTSSNKRNIVSILLFSTLVASAIILRFNAATFEKFAEFGSLSRGSTANQKFKMHDDKLGDDEKNILKQSEPHGRILQQSLLKINNKGQGGTISYPRQKLRTRTSGLNLYNTRKTKHRLIASRISETNITRKYTGNTLVTKDASQTVAQLTEFLRRSLDLSNIAEPRRISQPCGAIDYSSNAYKDYKPCVGAACKSIFNRTLDDRIKELVRDSQYQLSRSQLAAILSLSESIPETDVIFVTAASSNHYNEMQAMFRNLHETVFPTMDNFLVVIFDLGLKPDQIKTIKQKCRCILLNFNPNLFPPHVKDLHCYSWKPLIVKAMMPRAKKLLIWQDASVRWTPSFNVVLTRAERYGMQVRLGGGDRVTANTLHQMFTYMQEEECAFESVSEINAAVIVFHAVPFISKVVVDPWARCALEANCMCPGNPDVIRHCKTVRPHRCHRFDQSALTLILSKLYYDQRHKIEIPDSESYVKVMRHHTDPRYFYERRHR